MDTIIITLFLSILVISVILIIITFISLPQLGDERKNLIKMKAQSYTFVIVIFYFLFEIGSNIYKLFWGDGSYEGVNPFIFLTTISIIYLISLLVFKKKYGA